MRDLDRRVFFESLALTGLVVGPALAQSQSDNVAGKVDEAVGVVTVEGKGAQKPLVPQETVFIGDTVATGSASKLGMRPVKTLLRLGELARINIDRFLVNAGGTILAERRSDAARQGEDDRPISIRSPFGLISVRGTRSSPAKQGCVGRFRCERIRDRRGCRQHRYSCGGVWHGHCQRGAAPTTPARWGDERIRLALASVS